jgi:hypothetical protein
LDIQRRQDQQGVRVQRDEWKSALDIWRDSLVNLSGVNRLINFKSSKTGTVGIDSPEPDVILSGLRSSAVWVFQGVEADPESDDATGRPVAKAPIVRATNPALILHTSREEKELGRVLRNLMRRANAELLDRGLSVLYLAFGMLHWQDVDETRYVSPLLLVPVTLVSRGPEVMPELSIGEDDTVLNPSLVLRIRAFGVEFPEISDISEITITDLMTQIRRAVSIEKEWKVEPTVVLSTFSFHKEAMYRDLQENEAAVLDHPIVRALATTDPSQQSDAFVFDPIEPPDIDRLAPPEDIPLVLDADSSQRAAIAAATAGRTFVMDGPPGTGKSQTIANMVGALLHAGRTVLFVSEKAAALEVVRNRLADAGLDNYLLELHSHKASRKEVATALAFSLDNVPVPPPGMDTLKRSTLADRRVQLNDYAAAMNEVREPLFLSLHYVLGILAELAAVPSAPMPETPPADLTRAEYQAIEEVSRELQRSWRPAAQGQTYLWRDVIDESSLEIRLYQLEAALEELAGIVEGNRELATAFALSKPSDAATILRLTTLQHGPSRPASVPDSWALTNDWASVLQASDELTRDMNLITRAERAAFEKAGVPWTALPNPNSLPTANPPSCEREPLDLKPLMAATCEEVTERFEQVAGGLERRLSTLQAINRQLGLIAVVSFGDAERTLSLAELAYARNKPLRGWFGSAELAAVCDSIAALDSTLNALIEAETAATQFFTIDTLAAPLADLHERFHNRHRGLKKLTGEYRADKKTLSGLLVQDIKFKQGLERLPDAIRWCEASRTYAAALARHADRLGHYWRGRDTDFDSVDDAIRVTDRVLELMGGREVATELAEYLCGTEPPAIQLSLIEAIRKELHAWVSSLARPPALSGPPELALDPITSSVDWLRAHVAPLRQTAVRILAVQDVNQRAYTLAQADQILALREAAAATHKDLEAKASHYERTFGGYFRGPSTDLVALNLGLEWANQLRDVAGGPLTDTQFAALKASRATNNLEGAFAKWTSSRGRVISAFDSQRHTELSREIDDYQDAPSLINELRDDSTGQEEWFAYRSARAKLAKHGLDAAIDFCIEQQVPAEKVPSVVKRALLRSWADDVIRKDLRMRPQLARDRSALVDEYRDLDRHLIHGATSDIIRAANARRPSAATIGEPGVIRREGMKKARHLPVRELIARTRTTSLAIKPCFMMSPLAVSQYLPADMNFDVVIFDEASQVTPGDAINCIYRGKALILAGDDKQLPPTSFFERVQEDIGNDETDIADFQSVLELAKGCGAFSNLRLNWHYRSRHEALIAFSNYKFYDGKLVTYPSARSEGPHVGVEFFHVNGIYRRGGGADNPLEAVKVAERVIEHFTTRPDLTLGVVTFSVAQAEAIMDAIDKARELRRGLDRFFDGTDRLRDFFVKSLESVQGDERDVMIFSIGYGPDEAGKITANFGVLNKPKGWRRLNVAVTRARQRVEVVASVRAGNIPPSENENVEYLRAYLDYAERGQAALAIELGSSGLGPESPFEESVIKTIRAWGYSIEPQVGAAGFRIDIGVRHPAKPGSFALGVECDGYQYHSAPAARDRDRLRDQILRGLGWRMHRIWGTAWYRNRIEEEQRLRAAIDEAINAPSEGQLHAEEQRQPRRIVSVAEVEEYQTPSWTTEYRVAQVQSLSRWLDPSDPSSIHEIAVAIREMADVEGPVHIDVVRQRLREAWGIGRVGPRIRDNIDAAIRSVRGVIRADDFIDFAGRPVDRVRTPADFVRKAEHVHDNEVGLAIVTLLRDAGSTQRPELIVAVARIFGWARAGADINRRVAEVIDQLVAGEELGESDGRLTLLSNES